MQILGAIRAEARSGELAEILFFCQINNARLPISGQPNFMKFAHKTWFCDLVNPFGKFLVHGQVTVIFVVSAGLSVCLFVCAEFFSAVFDPISIKLRHMLHVWV